VAADCVIGVRKKATSVVPVREILKFCEWSWGRILWVLGEVQRDGCADWSVIRRPSEVPRRGHVDLSLSVEGRSNGD
jgi:hypothetical protein